MKSIRFVWWLFCWGITCVVQSPSRCGQERLTQLQLPEHRLRWGPLSLHREGTTYPSVTCHLSLTSLREPPICVLRLLCTCHMNGSHSLWSQLFSLASSPLHCVSSVHVCWALTKAPIKEMSNGEKQTEDMRSVIILGRETEKRPRDPSPSSGWCH